ncbi:hypothetical protein HHUSO_G6000 [Huso huso]|uniref:Uncharacterized protein n=1 Tax=Huso huso TaxID=61971 RepID=A0ABR1A3G2_HUSHU
MSSWKSSGKSGEGGESFPHDLKSQADIKALYKLRVFRAERLERPLTNLSAAAGPISHTGVRVTLEDKSQWLIHKGSGFGLSSETVVVKAEHISDKWKVIGSKDFGGTKTVSDFVKAGGTDYSVLFDNCHDGSKRMMDQH